MEECDELIDRMMVKMKLRTIIKCKAVVTADLDSFKTEHGRNSINITWLHTTITNANFFKLSTTQCFDWG